MDPLKKFKVMLNVPLGDVRAISLSPDPGNQLVVVGFSPASGHNDLIMSLVSAKGDDLVGEAVGVIASRYSHNSTVFLKSFSLSYSNSLGSVVS